MKFTPLEKAEFQRMMTPTRQVAREVDARVGTLADLETSEKDNLVAAINEIHSTLTALGAVVDSIPGVDFP